jgi:RNA polymerase primary sigma factor
MEELSLMERPNGISWLLDKADEQGYLTLDQISEAYPEAESEAALVSALEALFATLYERGVEVYDSEDVAREHRVTLELNDDGNGVHSSAPDLSGISVRDGISLYFKEMSHVPLLTREEEVELAKRLDQGRRAQHQLAHNGHDPEERARLKRMIDQGKEARRHLIAANTRLVVSIAKKYRGLGLPFMDLVQAGNIGLIKAVDKFDYRRGNKLATFATWWIRQAVTRSLSQQGRTIRIPVHMSDRIRRLHRTVQQLEQELGRRPTPEDIAEVIDLPPNRVRWLLRISRRPLSPEMPVGEEGESEFSSLIEDKRAPLPARSAERHLLHKDLDQMLTALTPREARVLRLRFGLQDSQSYSLKEIGEKLGVTRERARQIQCKALRKLRHPRHSRRLRSYLS